VVVVGLSYGGLDAQIWRGFNRFRLGGARWVVRNAGHNREYLDRELSLRPDGIPANVTDADLAQRLARLGAPVVDFSGFFRLPGLHLVGVDNRAVGEMGARHLLERGYRRFLFVSTGDRPFERQRWEGFAARLAAEGLGAQWVQVQACRSLDEGGRPTDLVRPGEDVWECLGRVERPLAVLAAYDAAAMLVCENCHRRGLAVPEQVALLGVDDFAEICEAALVPLSSVRLAGEKMGFDGAGALDALMRGLDPPHASPHLVPPVGVRERRSKNASAIADQPVARALAFIREHAAERINVADVMAYVHLDRRTLNRRFRAVVGRTPLASIYRARAEAAAARLADSDAKVARIAAECGFRDAKLMTAHFRRQFGLTPTEYRRQFRLT
jgi:LacI family transcriptional regulator